MISVDAGQRPKCRRHQGARAASREERDRRRHLARHSNIVEGRHFTLTTVEGGPAVLAPIATEYMRRYPDVQLQVELTDRHVDLVEEGFDLALRIGTLPDSSLVARKLTSLGCIRVYASPEYLARHGEPRRPQQLEKHDCLVMTGQREPATWTFLVRKEPVRVDVRARATANSFLLLRELAGAGLGIARLPDNVAETAVGAGKLRSLLDAYLPPPIPWHVVFPSARYLSPKLRGFIELVEERFGLAPVTLWSGRPVEIESKWLADVHRSS